jgi:hypothetical protein
MRKWLVSAAVCSSALVLWSVVALAGDYQRVVLVSWDGVRRDVLYDLLEVDDPLAPCWNGSTVFPVDTGRLSTEGAPIFTCLPALAGAKPSWAPAASPAYAPFQMVGSHTTRDGSVYTLPQHASMLSGYDMEVHGLGANLTSARMPLGFTIYEKLMDAFDPVPPGGKRNGFLFRTHHSGDAKYVGTSITYWAKKLKALQVKTGHGIEGKNRPGAMKYALISFAKWKNDADRLGLGVPRFFMFLHFKETDWVGHKSGDPSPQYRQAIVESDNRLYDLLEALRSYGWTDTAILVNTDHGFDHAQHHRLSGRPVFNTWLAAYNVQLSLDHIPLRTPADYCAWHQDPAACLANGPEIPMPDEDVVPNVDVTFVVPTILDMFGVEWRGTPGMSGESLYLP